MANHYKLDMWTTSDGRLHLDYTDVLTGEFDRWYIHTEEDGWGQVVDNNLESPDPNEWHRVEPVEIDIEIRQLLEGLNNQSI